MGIESATDLHGKILDASPLPSPGQFSSLPTATKLWPRLCFYSCLWFCPRGGVCPIACWVIPPRPKSRHPPDQKQTPPQTKSRHPRDQKQTPPGTKSRHPPPLRHTVNEWPVRILLECILVLMQLSVNFGQIVDWRPSCRKSWIHHCE